MLDIIQIPLLKDNYAYMLHEADSGETAVVDPSSSIPVLDLLKERGWSLKYIINTHHHYDHTGGNEDIKAQTGCKIICSYTDRDRVPGGVDITVREGDVVSIGTAQAKVMEIPGHTIGCVAFWFEKERAVFCGDTLFSLGCGRLFEGTAEQMWNSLRRLGALPRTTKIYCGHEYTQANGKFALSVDPHNQALKDYLHHVDDLRAQGLPTIPSTVEIEVKANPFLRAPMLRQETLNLKHGFEPHEAFAELRRKKDDIGCF